MKRPPFLLSQPSIVVLVYIVLSGLWILFSDQIVEQLFASPDLITLAQTIKGWVFVVVSGLVLYWIIRHSGRELEKNRDHYKTMLENAKVGIARMVDMKIVSFNPAFHRILNGGSANTNPSAFIETLEDNDRNQFLKSVRSLSLNRSVQHEFQLNLSENKKKWVLVIVSKHRKDEVEYYQIILQDINDRKTYQAYTDLLLKVILKLEPSDNFNDALKGILNHLCMELNWEYGIAFTPDEEGLFTKQVSWYRLDPLLDELDFIFDVRTFQPGDSVIGKTIEDRQAAWVDYRENEVDNEYRQSVLDADLSSCVRIPVIVSNEVIAMLELYSRESAARDHNLIRLLTAIGHDIGIKLEKLKHQDEKEKLEESLNYALRSAEMATWDIEVKSGKILSSKNHFELLGLNRSPDEWNVQKLIETVIPEDRERVETALADAVTETKGLNTEFRVVKDERIRWLWLRGDLQFDIFGEPARLSGVITDITQRKETEYELKRERELLELLYENIPVMITVYRPDFSNFRINNEFEKVTGWKNNELTQVNIFDEVFPDKELQRQIMKFMESPDSGWMDMPMRTKSGAYIQSTWTNVRLSDDTQVGIGLDISDRKAMEEQLREQKLYLSESQRIANLGTYRLNVETGEAEATDILKEIFGFEAGHDLHIEDWQNTLHPEHRDEIETYYEKVLKEKKRFEKEYKIIRAGDAAVRWVYENAELEMNEEGRPIYMIGAVQDITRRKEYELKIKRSEAIAKESRELIRKIIESLEEAVIILNPTSRTVIDCNRGTERMFGYDRDEMIGRTTEFLHLNKEKFLEFHEKSIQQLLETGLFRTEYELRKKSGETLFSDHTVTLVKDDAGEIDRVVSVIRDVTEQKTHEERIRKHRDRLVEAEEVARMGHWEYNIDTNQLLWSDMVYSIFGLDEESFDPSVEEFISYIHPKDRDMIRTSKERLLKDGKLEHIYRFIKPDGGMLYIQERGKYIENEKGRILTGTVIDITDLKKVEEKLETERQRFELAVGAVSDVVWDYDAVAGTLWWSEGIETVFGYDREEISGDFSFWEKHIFEEDRKATIKSIRQAEKSNSLVWLAFYRFLDAEGNIREVEDTAKIIRDEEGNLVRMIGAMLDVTELKMYRRELLQERSRFEIIAQSTNDIIYDLNLENDDLWANDELQTIMGYDPEEYQKPLEWWEDHLHPEDRESVLIHHEKFLESGGERWESEYRFIGNDQEILYIRENMYAVRDEDGTAVRLLGAMIDITAEKESEKVLRESEEQYRRLFEQNPYPMLIFDPDSDIIVQVNRAAVNMYGYSVEEFKEMTIYEFHPPDGRKDLKQRLIKGRNGLKYYSEINHQTKIGKKLVVNITALDIQYKGDKRRLVVINDITEQKKAEERVIGSVIEGSENERRRIAKELHDGLGQFLTAASLNLDSVYDELTTLPENKLKQYEKGLKLLRNAIIESRRISQNLLPKAIEDFGLGLAVQSLVDDISGSSDIEMSYSDNLNGVVLGENVELNIYRIIQEGVNNAVRHAGCTRIDIQLILDEKQLICTIEDNGSGFEIAPGESQGLGITNIKNRVNALSGDVEISSTIGKGTLITVIVPVNVV
jgi:PAS domain S-box-containing protein